MLQSAYAERHAGQAERVERRSAAATRRTIRMSSTCWQRTAPPTAHLHIFSIEGYPLRADEARRALAAWPELEKVTTALLDAWPDATPGFHRIDLPACRATLDLAVGEVGWALDAWSGRADAWFLDGFSPATNPDMWSPAVLDAIAARSAPGARLATFTVAGSCPSGPDRTGVRGRQMPGARPQA